MSSQEPPSVPSRDLSRFAVSPARRRKDRIARGAVLGCTVLALIPLLLIVYYLLRKGLSSWSINFFTTDPTGNTFFKSSSIGGIKSAILGTIEIVALASLIAVPIGVAIAVWLVEYGKSSWFANLVRFFVDVLTGVPSILFGLFIYIVLIIGTGTTYAGYKGSLALSLLDASRRDPLRRGDPVADTRRAARVGARSGSAALAGDLQRRAADRAAGHGHRRAARDRARCG